MDFPLTIVAYTSREIPNPSGISPMPLSSRPPASTRPRAGPGGPEAPRVDPTWRCTRACTDLCPGQPRDPCSSEKPALPWPFVPRIHASTYRQFVLPCVPVVAILCSHGATSSQPPAQDYETSSSSGFLDGVPRVSSPLTPLSSAGVLLSVAGSPSLLDPIAS